MDLTSGAILFVGPPKCHTVLFAVTDHLPQATIEFDKFHVVKQMNDKLSDLRRELYREATDRLAVCIQHVRPMVDDGRVHQHLRGGLQRRWQFGRCRARRERPLGLSTGTQLTNTVFTSWSSTVSWTNIAAGNFSRCRTLVLPALHAGEERDNVTASRPPCCAGPS